VEEPKPKKKATAPVFSDAAERETPLPGPTKEALANARKHRMQKFKNRSCVADPGITVFSEDEVQAVEATEVTRSQSFHLKHPTPHLPLNPNSHDEYPRKRRRGADFSMLL